MIRTLGGLLVFPLLAAATTVQAQYAYSTNADGSVYTYNTNADGSANIAGYAGPPWDVTIPSNINGLTVTSIGFEAFVTNRSLTSVTIPSSITNIGQSAFQCISLTNITVDPESSFYSSTNGALFDINQNTLIQYPCSLAGNYTVPSSVTSIGSYAFSDCQLLTGLMIPDSVTNIGQSAFAACFSLTNVTIPNRLPSIANALFVLCNSLTDVTIPNSVTNIDMVAFEGCSSLRYVTIGSNVNSIGSYAFEGCRYLTEVYFLGNAPTVVGSDVFQGDDATVRYLQGTTGWGPTFAGLPATLWDPQVPYIYTTNNGTIIITEYIGFGSVVAIPDMINGLTVTSIGYEAFEYSFGLTSITIPGSITNIGYNAFASCISLSKVYFTGNAPAFAAGGLFEYDTNPTIYYMSGTTGWSSPFAYLPPMLWDPFGPSGDASVGVQDNQFGFNFTGPANLAIVVKACTNLANPVWIPLQTNTIANGAFSFSDPQWANYPSRYYRMASP